MEKNNPRILRNTVRGTEFIELNEHFLAERKIFLLGEVTPEAATGLIKQVMYLQSLDRTGEVTLYIDSGGGNVISGLSLYDVLKSLSVPLKTVCIGNAASMAGILFLAGDKRVMLPHSRLMLHDPSYSHSNIDGLKAHEIKEMVTDLDKVGEELVKIISDVTGHSIEEIREVTRKDSFYSAEEALSFNLATEITNNIGG